MEFVEKELIRKEIQSISAKPQGPGDDENLFDSSFLDSIDFIKLIRFIEENLKVSFEMTDLQLKNFTTINRILESIDRRRRAAK